MPIGTSGGVGAGGGNSPGDPIRRCSWDPSTAAADAPVTRSGAIDDIGNRTYRAVRVYM